MIASTGSTLPSANLTRSPSSSATSGLATASPEPRRSSSSLETVGCASRKWWLGVGRPKSSIRPETSRGSSPADPALEAQRQPRVRLERPDRPDARTRTWGSPTRRCGSTGRPPRRPPCATARRRCRRRCCRSRRRPRACRTGRAARSDRCSGASAAWRRRTRPGSPDTTGPSGGRCTPAARRTRARAVLGPDPPSRRLRAAARSATTVSKRIRSRSAKRSAYSRRNWWI